MTFGADSLEAIITHMKEHPRIALGARCREIPSELERILLDAGIFERFEDSFIMLSPALDARIVRASPIAEREEGVARCDHAPCGVLDAADGDDITMTVLQ